MSADPFNKFYLCNFNDLTKVEDVPFEPLRQVWRCEWTKNRLENILQRWQEHKEAKEAQQLLCDVAELTLIFVQNNFTGPFTLLPEFENLVRQLALPECDPFVRLIENGEEINPNVKLGELLVVAKHILAQLLVNWPESLLLNWWHMRLTCVHQQILDEMTANLYEHFKTSAQFLLKKAEQLQDEELLALLYMELANGYLHFQRTHKSDEVLNEFCQRLKVSLNVEGLLGLRTKHQQKPLPQLCLKVAVSNSLKLPAAVQTNGSSTLPKLLQLDDDTRLERIRFMALEDNEVMTLPSVLQALVLARVKQLKRAQPHDRLADEEVEPYIQTLLYQEHGPLQVRQSALLLNCAQEASQRRTVERSWRQCEEAVKLLSSSNYTLHCRLSYAFASCLQPKWQLQLQLCELLISLGMTKTALDIYTQLQAWTEVIDCYTHLEMRHNAAEIIRQELQKRQTVTLHCLLGDATDDVACYATAWELSKFTSGKAQAHWGNYYYRRKEYAQALPHLEKSVEINALQQNIWLRLGYSAIMLERWPLAVHAYITFTHLEPLGFESWNNLAKALVKLGDKARAHKVLSESLKCNYNNWRVWENFMLVSVDTSNYEDALNAYTRLTETRERYLDLEVLCILMASIAQGKKDAKGQTSERLIKKANTLLGQQCIQHGNEPKLWELAALLATTPLKKAQKLLKAYHAHTSRRSDATPEEAQLIALKICHGICENTLEACKKLGEGETNGMLQSQLSSARLTAQACLRTTTVTPASGRELRELLVQVESLLGHITAVLTQRK